MSDFSSGAHRGLPLRGRRIILGSHEVFTGYAHWLSNDLRGSGSTEIRKEELSELGPIHLYRSAEPLLDHPIIWFNAEMRRVIADAFGREAARRGYTLWARSSRLVASSVQGVPVHSRRRHRTHRLPRRQSREGGPPAPALGFYRPLQALIFLPRRASWHRAFFASACPSRKFPA